MAAGDRESTFTIRAADLSSQALKDVVAQLDRLIASQTKVNESAKAGTITNSEFGASLRALQSSLSAVANQNAAIENYGRLQGVLTARIDATTAAQVRLQTARTAQENAGSDVTDAQAKRLQRQVEVEEKRVNSAQKRQDIAQGNLDESAAQLERMGIATDKLAEAQEELRAAIARGIPALQAARIEELNLTENRRQAAAVARQEADAERERAAAVRASADIAKRAIAEEADILKTRENARKADFEAAIAAQEKQDKLAAEAQAAAAERARQVKAFEASQQKVDSASEALPGREPLGQPNAAIPDFRGASQGLLAILDPAAAARQNIQGLSAEVTSVTANLSKSRLRLEDYQAALRQLTSVTVELKRQGSLVDLFRNQEAAVGRLDAQLKQAEGTLGAMTELYRRNNVVDREAEQRILAQTAAVRRATEAYNEQNAKLAETGAALRRAGADTDELTKYELELAATAAKAQQQIDKAASKTSRAGGDTVFLGLKPYELTNLSYQINDVFTQLGSGARISQVFAQQGGQFEQVFQRDIAATLSGLSKQPALLAAAGAGFATLTVGVFAFIRALEIAQERQAFLGQNALSVDGSRINVERAIAAATEYRKLGVGIQDAIAGQRELAGQGFGQQQIERLGKLAALLSSTGRGTFASQIKEVSAAFSGGYEQLSKFTDTLNSLDVNTGKQVRDLFEAGKASEAFGIAYAASLKKAEEASKASSTAIGTLFRDIRSNIDDALDSVSKFSEGFIGFFQRQAREAEKTKALLRGDAPPNAPPSTTPTTAQQFSPAGFAAQRDRAADIAGVDREVLRVLQESENKPDKNGNFPDGIAKDGSIAGRGPLQVTASTFEDVKKRYPELIKGAVTDLADNLLAGALYFREQLVKANGDVTLATRAYKQGPNIFKDPKSDAGHPEYTTSAISVGLATQGRSALTTPQPNLINAPAPAAPFSDSGVLAEGVKRVTGDYLKTVADATAKLQDTRLTGDASVQRQREVIDDELRKIEKDARDYAQQRNQSQIDEPALRAAQDQRRQVLEQQFAQARLDNERTVAEGLKEASRQAVGQDPTNLAQRRQAVNDEFDARRRALEKPFTGLEAAQTVNGRNRDQVFSDLETSRQTVLTNTDFEVAQATLDKQTAARKSALELLKAQGKVGSDFAEAAAKVNEKYNPLIQEAINTLNKTADRVVQTPGVQEARVKAATAQADLTGAQGDTNAALTEAFDRSQKPLQDLLAIRQNKFLEITEREKSGAITIGQAVRELSEVTSKLAPDIQRSVDKVNADLRGLLTNPSLSPVVRSNIEAAIAKNTADAARSQELIQGVIDAGLKDVTEKLTAETADRDRQVGDVLRQFSEGLINVGEASGKLSTIAAAFKDKVAGDAAKVVQALQTALTVPGLTPGARSSLQEQLTKAQQVGNTDSSEIDNTKSLIGAGLTRVQQQGVGAVRDTAQTNAALLTKGLITQEQAERSNERAFQDANRAVAEQEAGLEKLIDRLQELGASSSTVDLYRNKLRLVRAELQYIDPLTQQVTSGLENSFEGRGTQVFEDVAKSLGTIITQGGKISDVFQATGIAFANFTAGVLQDIAKIILKYELLKLIKSILGSDKGGGGGGDLGSAISSFSNDGSGDGFAPEDSTGVDEASGGGGGGGNTAGNVISIVASVAKIAAAVAHDGGSIDTNGRRREVDMSLFKDAQRYHDGGLVGLAHDEVPAILQRGERVQSVAEVRAQQQGDGGGGSTATPVRNVLAVGDDEISRAMAGSHGEQVVINHLRRNAPTVKRLLG